MFVPDPVDGILVVFREAGNQDQPGRFQPIFTSEPQAFWLPGEVTLVIH
jgi:hypothetical protein